VKTPAKQIIVYITGQTLTVFVIIRGHKRAKISPNRRYSMNKVSKEEIIDMTRYVESEEIHEKCVGCSKVFDYVPTEGMIASQKCRAYIRPSMWWEEKPVALVPALVRSKTNPKGVMGTLPVKRFICPLANHVKISEDTGKVFVNPLKASKRARK
jgi:hypothetical protein